MTNVTLVRVSVNRNGLVRDTAFRSFMAAWAHLNELVVSGEVHPNHVWLVNLPVE